MGRHCRPGRPRNGAPVDPFAATLLERIAPFLDAPQIQAAEAFVALRLLVHGAPDSWPDPPPRGRLAELLEDHCPALLGIADDGTATARRRYRIAAPTLRAAYAATTIEGDWRLLEGALIEGCAPAFLTGHPIAAAFSQLQEFRRMLNRLCRLFGIARRDTELMGEGP